MKKQVIWVAMAAVMLVGCGKKANQAVESSENERVEQVRTLVLQPQEIEREISVSSNLEGYQTVNIAPSLTGRIEHIYVEVGDKKKAGEMLVRMDQNQYKTTKLTFANLEIEKTRMDALLKSGSVSQQQYDQIKLSYDQTKESLDFLEENTYVKAPFAGVIAAKNYEDGELYGGQPIVVLTEIQRLKALVAVPERYFPLIKKGMQLAIHSDIYPNKSFAASIEVIYPTIDASTHTFVCKVVVPNASEVLRPGMYINATIPAGKSEAIIVPYQSVLKLQGSNERYVFVNNNGRAKRVGVTLGQRFDDKTEIISDEISAGDELVTVGQARLIDGVKLNVVAE